MIAPVKSPLSPAEAQFVEMFFGITIDGGGSGYQHTSNAIVRETRSRTLSAFSMERCTFEFDWVYDGIVQII